jgi:hypothetical protein
MQVLVCDLVEIRGSSGFHISSWSFALFDPFNTSGASLGALGSSSSEESRARGCLSEGPLEAGCTRNLEKNRHLSQPYNHERSRTGWRRLWRHPRPQTWQARAWGGQRPTAPPSREKTRLGREIWGHTFPRRGHPFPRRKSISRRGRRDTPPRSGETGGKGCRRAGRRVRHARGRPVL